MLIKTKNESIMWRDTQRNLQNSQRKLRSTGKNISKNKNQKQWKQMAEIGVCVQWSKISMAVKCIDQFS
jgi:hypothetical protein